MNAEEKFAYLLEIAELEDTDFTSWKIDYCKAPASSKYHHAYEGGLIDHALEVYHELKKHNVFSPKSNARVALLHDLCKVHAYTPNYNKDGKTLNARWPYKTISETYGLGHGGYSLTLAIMILGEAELSLKEQFAIRWHMTSDDYNWKTYRKHVMKVCPEIVYVKGADEVSANMEEMK